MKMRNLNINRNINVNSKNTSATGEITVATATSIMHSNKLKNFKNINNDNYLRFQLNSVAKFVELKNTFKKIKFLKFKRSSLKNLNLFKFHYLSEFCDETFITPY